MLELDLYQKSLPRHSTLTFYFLSVSRPTCHLLRRLRSEVCGVQDILVALTLPLHMVVLNSGSSEVGSSCASTKKS